MLHCFGNLLTLSAMLAMFVVDIFRVPTRTGKPGKMGRHFPVGILNRLRSPARTSSAQGVDE